MKWHRSPITLMIGLFILTVVAFTAVRAEPLPQRSRNCTATSDPTAPCNVIQGYGLNSVAHDVTGATIGGGGTTSLANQVVGDNGTVSGGIDNQAGERATVGGGAYNRATGSRSTIAGGTSNTASSAFSTIGGGTNNTASHIHTTIGGGIDNVASDLDATVAGGSGNIASYMLATVGGGGYNTANSFQSTVAGGGRNVASGAYSTIAGGTGNQASGFDTAIGGGSGNVTSGENSIVGGGLANRATGKYSTVGGGYVNRAGTPNEDEVQYATVSGGSENTASGYYASVPGGASNTAAGAYSVAAGRRANVLPSHNGAFVYADSTDAPFSSQAANEFAVRATGGVRLVTAIDAGGAPKAGVRLAPGGGAWESLSDRDAKANFAPVDGRGILTALVGIPITTWNYKTEDPSVRHIGPMAQDLHALGVGADSHYINTLDADGVAFAAIQGLYHVVQEKEARIQVQQKEIDTLRSTEAKQEAEIADLQTRLAELEHKTGNGQPAGAGMVGSNLPLLLAAGLGIFALAKRQS